MSPLGSSPSSARSKANSSPEKVAVASKWRPSGASATLVGRFPQGTSATTVPLATSTSESELATWLAVTSRDSSDVKTKSTGEGSDVQHPSAAHWLEIQEWLPTTGRPTKSRSQTPIRRVSWMLPAFSRDRKWPLQFFPIDSLASLYSGFRLAPIQVEPCTRKTRVETHEPHLAADALRQFCWRGSPSIDGGREIGRQIRRGEHAANWAIDGWLRPRGLCGHERHDRRGAWTASIWVPIRSTTESYFSSSVMCPEPGVRREMNWSTRPTTRIWWPLRWHRTRSPQASI